MSKIVQQILDGDKDAFRKVVRRYGPEIRAFLASSLSDCQVVDDLAQETFIATYESLERFKPGSNLRSWIYGIARNKLRMHLRRVYREKDFLVSMESGVVDRVLSAVEDRCSDGDNHRVRNLRDCIERLPEENRQLIKSRYFDNAKVMDLAARMKRTENAVSVILHRLRATLRECMEGAAHA